MKPEVIADCLFCGGNVYRDTNWSRATTTDDQPGFICDHCITGNSDKELLEDEDIKSIEN